MQNVHNQEIVQINWWMDPQWQTEAVRLQGTGAAWGLSSSLKPSFEPQLLGMLVALPWQVCETLGLDFLLHKMKTVIPTSPGLLQRLGKDEWECVWMYFVNCKFLCKGRLKKSLRPYGWSQNWGQKRVNKSCVQIGPLQSPGRHPQPLWFTPYLSQPCWGSLLGTFPGA